MKKEPTIYELVLKFKKKYPMSVAWRLRKNFLDSVTPELFNDLKVLSGVIWGKIHIDTVKEFITLSNIDKKALPEIETMITSYMMKEKQKLNGIKDK